MVGTLKICRTTNISALPPPPKLPAMAYSFFDEVRSLKKRFDTVIWMHCGSNYSICQSTVPRWQRYAVSLRYDFLVLRARNPSITGIATQAWDRLFVARQLLLRRYQWVMHVDGDTAVLAWRLSVHEFVRRTGRGENTFLYLSQDAARPATQHVGLGGPWLPTF